MGYSMPRRLPSPLPPNECTRICGYCGAKWLRSQCRKDASGFILCEDCDDGGRDQVTLDRENAAAAQSADARLRKPPPDW